MIVVLNFFGPIIIILGFILFVSVSFFIGSIFEFINYKTSKIEEFLINSQDAFMISGFFFVLFLVCLSMGFLLIFITKGCMA